LMTCSSAAPVCVSCRAGSSGWARGGATLSIHACQAASRA
jgi:hypothetical protein